MRNTLRRNARGDIQIGSITPWTLQDFLDLSVSGKIGKDTQFECPICHGHKKQMTSKSLIDLNNHIDDYGNSNGFKPTYRRCSHCNGTGQITASKINLHLGGGRPTRTESKTNVNLVMEKLEVK